MVKVHKRLVHNIPVGGHVKLLNKQQYSLEPEQDFFFKKYVYTNINVVGKMQMLNDIVLGVLTMTDDTISEKKLKKH